MGIAAGMEASMKKNMEAQMQFQKELIIKQRQTQMAMQVALGRERFCYFQEFFCMVVPLCILGAYLKKEPKLLGPILPLSFAYAFQYDMFYGKMFERAQLEADQLITTNPNKFRLPEHSGIVTMSEYDKIFGIKENKRA